MPGRTFFPNLSEIITFAAAPLVLTPFVRKQLYLHLLLLLLLLFLFLFLFLLLLLLLLLLLSVVLLPYLSATEGRGGTPACSEQPALVSAPSGDPGIHDLSIAATERLGGV